MTLNVNLGSPYEAIIKKMIEKGYAASQTEVIRQALTVYGRYVDEEEVKLVGKGIESEMREIRGRRTRTKSLAELKKKYKL
ncbi:MAG: hypothetical protein PHS02_00455 [Candidatus ainarchaeum sp.]|nr:hypothetical protein [Candidatus ainarchaeum sp.]